MINIAVLVSGGGSNQQAIIDAKARGEIPSGELKCVIASKSGCFALERAEKHGIPGFCVDKGEYEDRSEFGAAIDRILAANGIGLVVLAGFMWVLPPELVKKYENRIINVHPSLIPSFCGDGFFGLRVHKAALDYGVKVTGASVIYVNEITDGGKIIAQKAVEVLDGDTPEILQKRVMEQAEWVILPQACEKLCKEMLEGK